MPGVPGPFIFEKHSNDYPKRSPSSRRDRDIVSLVERFELGKKIGYCCRIALDGDRSIGDGVFECRLTKDPFDQKGAVEAHCGIHRCRRPFVKLANAPAYFQGAVLARIRCLKRNNGFCVPAGFQLQCDLALCKGNHFAVDRNKHDAYRTAERIIDGAAAVRKRNRVSLHGLA